jgi:hypothetical protein
MAAQLDYFVTSPSVLRVMQSFHLLGNRRQLSGTFVPNTPSLAFFERRVGSACRLGIA